jgi:hypothetical protein
MSVLEGEGRSGLPGVLPFAAGVGEEGSFLGVVADPDGGAEADRFLALVFLRFVLVHRSLLWGVKDCGEPFSCL